MVENSFKTYQKRKVPSRVRGFYCSGFGTNRSARFLSPTRSFHDLLGCALCCCCFGSLLCFGHGFGFPRFVLGPAAGRTTLRTEVAPGTPINLGTIICNRHSIGGSTFSWGSTSHTNDTLNPFTLVNLREFSNTSTWTFSLSIRCRSCNLSIRSSTTCNLSIRSTTSNLSIRSINPIPTLAQLVGHSSSIGNKNGVLSRPPPFLGFACFLGFCSFGLAFWFGLCRGLLLNDLDLADRTRRKLLPPKLRSDLKKYIWDL